jgi:hypothetical protein
MRGWLLVLLGCAGGGEKLGVDSATDTAGPCASESLPACPPACPEDAFEVCGQPCTVEGETCGNSIGDGRVCDGGVWSCSVHAPLEPEGCNRVCDPGV